MAEPLLIGQSQLSHSHWTVLRVLSCHIRPHLELTGGSLPHVSVVVPAFVGAKLEWELRHFAPTKLTPISHPRSGSCTGPRCRFSKKRQKGRWTLRGQGVRGSGVRVGGLGRGCEMWVRNVGAKVRIAPPVVARYTALRSVSVGGWPRHPRKRSKKTLLGDPRIAIVHPPDRKKRPLRATPQSLRLPRDAHL